MASIKKRPDGVWRARYRDGAGKEHARHFPRKIDAQNWLDEVTTAVKTGRYVDPAHGRETLGEYYPTFRVRQVWTAGTRAAADTAVGSCSFSDVPFGKLRRSHVEAWVKGMSEHLAPSTVRTRFNYVKIVIRAAVADRRLAEDVTAGVRLPASRKREHAMVIPTPEQVRDVLKAADEHYATLFALCAFGGLRLGEAAGVQLADINFLRRMLHIERQVQRAGAGAVEIRAPKYGSERDVYLPDALLQTLSGHIERGVIGDAEWLFRGPHGNPPDRAAVGYWWRKATKAADVDFHLHDLRHFYASGLIAAGCDVVTVQRALGHSNASITLSVYSHLWPTAEDTTRRAAAGLMGQVFSPPADSGRTAEG
ncbi:site-specific integrase [Kocuria salina]|uniref:tyrosine-type recombinase/integrase n=1 Tax=Kocuria salina TaxID=1929416 RepID=UPI00159403A4|nr:site-specific integrase [Kocuria salina]NVC24054.1 site-specific integrase [Kocuria salina]